MAGTVATTRTFNAPTASPTLYTRDPYGNPFTVDPRTGAQTFYNNPNGPTPETGHATPAYDPYAADTAAMEALRKRTQDEAAAATRAAQARAVAPGSIPVTVNGGSGARISGSSGGGGTSTNPLGDPSAQAQGALNSLMAEIRQQNTSVQPSTVPVVRSGSTAPFDQAAQSAAYGAAKERTGQSMQAAMSGLRAMLMQRGITGSGIEADKTADVYARGLSELGATDRQMAEQASGRAFTAEQANTDRVIDQNRFNAGQVQSANTAQQQLAMQKLSQLISSFGQVY